MTNPNKFQGVKTTIRTDVIDGRSAIVGRYHETDVCILFGDRTVRLNSGGFRTATTKMRMNQFAREFCNRRFSVVQRNKQWIVLHNGREYEFRDGFEWCMG